MAVTFVANSCVGVQMIIQYFNQPYNNPFMQSLIVDDYEFVKLCKNFDHYINLEPVFGPPKTTTKWAEQNESGWFRDTDDGSIKTTYVVMHLEDVEIHYIHHNNPAEVLEKFKRRVERFKDQKATPIFLLADSELHLDYTDEEYGELMKEWNSIPNSIFLARPSFFYPIVESNKLDFPESRGLGEFDCYRASSHTPNQIRIICRNWKDFVRTFHHIYKHIPNLNKLYAEMIKDLIPQLFIRQ